MTTGKWRRLVLTAISGGILLQVPGCAEVALGVTTIASAITAGGVIYLVRKIMD